MCASGWAASWAPISASRALIWLARVLKVATRAPVMAALAAPSAPVAPRGAACSRARSCSGRGALPRCGRVCSHAARSASLSWPAASCDPKRARNARLIWLSRRANSPAPAGNAAARWARSWLHAAMRCATRSRRARTAARKVMVAGMSGASGRSRARSVRSTSARTNASNRSSLAPADPYRDRRFFICREVITTTVSPASSSAPTSTPSPRSIAVSLTPAARSPAISLPRPALSWVTLNRARTCPAASTTQTAWSALAQSMPAVRPPGGVWGRTRIWAYFMTASSLLTQWGGTLIHGAGTRTVSSLSGAWKRMAL